MTKSCATLKRKDSDLWLRPQIDSRNENQSPDPPNVQVESGKMN
jgi:hypothetical protein